MWPAAHSISATPPRQSHGDGSAAQMGAGLIDILLRQAGLVTAVAAMVVVIATLVVLEMPLSYSSTAEVMFDLKKNRIADLSSVLAPAPGTVSEFSADAAAVQNQVRLLTSRNLAGRVVDRLERADNSVAGPNGETARDRAIDDFLKHVVVQPLGLSTTFSITYTSSDPRFASAAANALAGAYIEAQIQAKMTAARFATDWLTERIRILAADTRDADAAVEAYKREHGLNDAPDGSPLVDQQLSAVQTQLVQAQAALAEKQAVQSRLHMLAENGNSADNSEVSASTVIAQYRQQEGEIVRQMGDLSTRYGPKNPKLIAMENERKNIESKIAAEIQRVSGAVDSDVVEAAAQVHSLESALAKTQRAAAVDNAARSELQSLEGNAKSTRSSYEAYVSRLRDLQGDDNMQLPDASIISPAPVPSSPNPPKRSVLILASVPAGLLLGVLLALLRDAATGPARIESDGVVVETGPHATVLATLPDIAREGLPSRVLAETVLREPDSPFGYAIGELIGRLSADGRQVVAFASPDAGDGKSVVAANAARLAAEMGWRVALLDCGADGGVANMLRLTPSRAGLRDVLAGRIPLRQCLMRDRASGASVLSGRTPRVAGSHPLFAPNMTELIAHLRGAFDLIVLDVPSPAALPVLKAAADQSDFLVFVLGWNGTALPDVTKFNILSASVGLDRSGVVLAV
jgi:uncharacterized protein involved in exopolysaccharide biosynthesis